MKAYRTSQDNFLRTGLFIGISVTPLPDATDPKILVLEEPAGERVLGMIDTGAATSMIRCEVAERIGLEVRGSRELLAWTGPPVRVPTYAAVIAFEDGFTVETVLGGGDFEQEPGLDFLIGRDLLQHSHVCFHGPLGTLDVDFTDAGGKAVNL